MEFKDIIKVEDCYVKVDKDQISVELFAKDIIKVRKDNWSQIIYNFAERSSYAYTEDQPTTEYRKCVLNIDLFSEWKYDVFLSKKSDKVFKKLKNLRQEYEKTPNNKRVTQYMLALPRNKVNNKKTLICRYVLLTWKKLASILMISRLQFHNVTSGILEEIVSLETRDNDKKDKFYTK